MALNQMSPLTIAGQRIKSRESQMFFSPQRFSTPRPRKAHDTSSMFAHRGVQRTLPRWISRKLQDLPQAGATAPLSQGPTSCPLEQREVCPCCKRELLCFNSLSHSAAFAGHCFYQSRDILQ